MHRQNRTAAFIVCAALTWAAPAAAQDPIAYWNQQVVTAAGMAVVDGGRGPTPATFIDFATVHLAMHDAVQAYDKRFEPYAGAVATGSAVVAAAKAAHLVLVNRLRMQTATFDGAYTTFIASLSPAPSPADIAAGETYGTMAANNVIAARADDGSFPLMFPQFTGGTGVGQWFPNATTPGMVSPWAATVRPFALDSLARCRVEPPPSLTSFEWALNYIEVKLLGSATSPYPVRLKDRLRDEPGNFNGQYRGCSAKSPQPISAAPTSPAWASARVCSR